VSFTPKVFFFLGDMDDFTPKVFFFLGDMDDYFRPTHACAKKVGFPRSGHNLCNTINFAVEVRIAINVI